MNKLITIIIPVFNREKWINATLNSIQSQTYTHFECIIVDDGSTDKTEEMVLSFSNADKRFQFFKRPENRTKGPNSCRNFGLEKSKGEFIQWFDSDDFLFENALETYLNNFDEATDVVIAKLERIEYETGRNFGSNIIFSENLIDDYFTGNVSFYVCGPMWKKSFLVQQPELFDESIQNLDDWDFNLRMIYANPRIKFLDQVLIRYFQHENSLKRELKKLNKAEIDSAFRARSKQLELLKKNGLMSVKRSKTIILGFRKEMLRIALLKRHPQSFYFLKEILLLQFQLNYFKGIIKILAGYFLFKTFKSGYKLLK